MRPELRVESTRQLYMLVAPARLISCLSSHVSSYHLHVFCRSFLAAFSFSCVLVPWIAFFFSTFLLLFPLHSTRLICNPIFFLSCCINNVLRFVSWWVSSCEAYTFTSPFHCRSLRRSNLPVSPCQITESH